MSELHLAQYPALTGTHPLCRKHTDVQRRFGHVRVEVVIAPVEETCKGCLVERAKLREREASGQGHVPLIGIMVT